MRGQLGLGWDERTADELQLAAVTSLERDAPSAKSRRQIVPNASLQQAFTVLLDDCGVAHVAGDGMDCVFGVGGGMGVVGSYHGGTQPVAKAEFQPLKALQHKTLVQIATTKRSVAAVSTSGHVYTWGSGYHGELGHGHQSVLTSPTLLPLTQEAAEDAASMMMPPSEEFFIESVHAGDGFMALRSAAGQVYVSGVLGPKYAGGVPSTVQVSPAVMQAAPPPPHLRVAAAVSSAPSTAAASTVKPQSSRPLLLAEGGPLLAAGKHHLVLAYPHEVLIAGDNSAAQATSEPPPVSSEGPFPLWRALTAESLPAGSRIAAAFAYGDCSAIEVHIPTTEENFVRCVLLWGGVPADMAQLAHPLPPPSAPVQQWESFLGLQGSGTHTTAADASSSDGSISMASTQLGSPHLLRLPDVPRGNHVLGWWQGQLLFGESAQ